MMAELRPDIQCNESVPNIKRLNETAGFKLAYLFDGEVKAVAGFRIPEMAGGGKIL